MEQRAGDAIGPDHRVQLLFDRVRRREMPGAEAGDGDDGFADGVFFLAGDGVHAGDSRQPLAPKMYRRAPYSMAPGDVPSKMSGIAPTRREYSTAI